jgi:hypothetical protein
MRVAGGEGRAYLPRGPFADEQVGQQSQSGLAVGQNLLYGDRFVGRVHFGYSRLLVDHPFSDVQIYDPLKIFESRCFFGQKFDYFAVDAGVGVGSGAGTDYESRIGVDHRREFFQIVDFVSFDEG